MGEPSEIVDKRRTFRFYLDDAVIDTYGPAIGAYGIAVYALLVRHAKQKQSFPSYKYMTKKLGLSRQTITRTLDKLAKAGLITIAKRQSAYGDHDTNLYTIMDLSHLHIEGTSPHYLPTSTDTLPTSSRGGGVGNVGTEGTSPRRLEGISLKESHRKEENPSISPQKEMDTPVRPKARINTKASKAPGTNYTDGYAHFWAAYPRKEGKVEAFTIWQARTLEPRAVEIAAKVERLTLTLWAGRERDKIPLPTTYLNQARYEDDLVPLEVAQQHLMRGRMTDREYRSMLAGQRFEERGNGTTGPLDLSDGDADVIDDVQYRIE